MRDFVFARTRWLSYRRGVLRILALAMVVLSLRLSSSEGFSRGSEDRIETPLAPGPRLETKLEMVWASETNVVIVTNGAPIALSDFSFTNLSVAALVVKNVRTSCGCTSVRLPPVPWLVPPGGAGQIHTSVDLSGKEGLLFKTVTVETDRGSSSLQIKVVIVPSARLPESPSTNAGQLVESGPGLRDPERGRSFQIARGDRQAVFKAGCAACHAKPAEHKQGGELYAAVCAICHDTPNRATMTPDLHKLPRPPNAGFWRASISRGKLGSLMPAFAVGDGGPLSEAQIGSLVDYLTTDFPSAPALLK
jgi:mono/diheme cytochrome c family protein